jgi:uncharacterized protein
MPAPYMAPDVYIEEISTFPPSVAEVETAVPAFIGYTEKAKRVVDGDLTLNPTKIRSLKQYEELFGFDPVLPITLTVTGTAADTFAAADVTVAEESVAPDEDPLIPPYLMYYQVRMYFENGGGSCYIVSVGPYADDNAIDADDIAAGLDRVRLEDEPTLLIAPEAVKLPRANYRSLSQAMLTQCGLLQDRFALFDLYDGAADLEVKPPAGDGIPADNTLQYAAIDREYFGNRNLKYGAAYYPFLRTDLNYRMVEDPEVTSNVTVKYGTEAAQTLDKFSATADTPNTGVYNFVRAELQKYYVNLPPSGAVAGVYAATDTSRGVWKAPANVSLTRVIEPLVKVDRDRQDELNVDVESGKSVNAIRAFAGKGVLVWGARTLDGNSNEWRYVPVRRFFNMVEESVKKSTYWAVFETNDANTWVKVRGMIENYLTQKWREGALAGATTKDAFFVRCGLGTTMSPQDVLEGRLNVEIGMAVVRPAEFIILKFSHKLQTS